MIAEVWDAARLYQVGHFPGDGWSEWNGRASAPRRGNSTGNASAGDASAETADRNRRIE
jgi:pullulanase/glycogen debranching enzyme